MSIKYDAGQPLIMEIEIGPTKGKEDNAIDNDDAIENLDW